MGWNETCKQLRHDLFKGSPDSNVTRSYQSQITIKTDVFGYKHQSITLVSDGLHQMYRLMKHLYRYTKASR